MTDDVGTGFTAIFTIIIVMAFGIPMVPLIFCGIDWIAHYDRYEQYKMYRQQAIDELHSAADETGWYTELFDVYSHYADPRENYTFEEYKADVIEFHVTFNITPEIDNPDLGESLYQYLTSLHDMGYQHISLSIKDDLIGQVTLFNSDDDRPYLTDFNDKESFLKRVNRAIEKTADLTVNAAEKEGLPEYTVGGLDGQKILGDGKGRNADTEQYFSETQTIRHTRAESKTLRVYGPYENEIRRRDCILKNCITYN